MDYDALHPYPRYGAAAALVFAEKKPDQVTTAEALAPLVAGAIDLALTQFTLRTLDNPQTDADLVFDWVGDPKPGSKSGQDAKHGYYLAPHVVTSDGSVGRLLIAARGLAKEMRDGSGLDKPTKLTRTLTPLVAKVNSGAASLSEPRTTRLNAALSALATLTPLKAAAWALGNAALVPDLPMRDGAEFPLWDYVWLFGRMQRQTYDSGAAMRTKPKKGGGFKRPRLHDGNFPGAPRTGTLGALGVAASAGWWARYGGANYLDDAEAWAQRVLHRLAERPLLVVSYDGTRQERFGHHVVGLALSGTLRDATHDLWRVMPTAADSWSDPKVDLFRLMADRFIRLFTRPALRDFLAMRAEYPPSMGPVFDAYFTQHAMPPLSPALVASARAYGAALNTAAYRAARADTDSDQRRRGDDARTSKENKQRVLVEFESAVQSAKSGAELLAKVGSRAGRLAGYEMPPEAAPFMEAVAVGDGEGGIPIGQARDLVTAFMRLGTWTTKRDPGDDSAGEASNSSSNADAPAESSASPGDQSHLFPGDRS